jgi:hypothetical protein
MSSDILTLREAYDVFDKTRIPAFDLLALDVVWSIKDGHRDDVFRGLEEIEDIGEGWFLVVVRQRTRARMGGTETDERQFHLCRLQGGKVARLDVYFTRERALEAIAVVHDG